MRTLMLVPVIHMSADLGSLSGDVTKRGIADLGEDAWKRHIRTIEGFWDAIMDYFTAINVSGTKIYQDGMVAEGEMGEKIVNEVASSGSKNYKLIAMLIKKGAILVKTEDFNLVKEEHDRLIKITQAKTEFEKLFILIKNKATKDTLLNKRDRFIAHRIDETLHEGQTGVLFIGAYHDIERKLPKDIEIIEIKNLKRVREYHRLLPFYSKK